MARNGVKRSALSPSIPYSAQTAPQNTPSPHAGRYVILPSRALWGPWALPLTDLRILARILDAGAILEAGAVVSLPRASVLWGVSYDQLAASVRRLAAWGYLRRERAGRCQRFYALDWPRQVADPGVVPVWERPMRPLNKSGALAS